MQGIEKTKPDSLTCVRGYRESTLQSVTPFIEPTKKNEEKFMEYKEFERIISAKRMGRYTININDKMPPKGFWDQKAYGTNQPLLLKGTYSNATPTNRPCTP